MGYFNYSKLNDKEIILTKYIPDSSVEETITVPSTIGCFEVKKVGANCFDSLTNDGKEIIFPSCISIDDLAIVNCDKLESVILGESDKFNSFIGNNPNIIRISCKNSYQLNKIKKIYKNALNIYPFIPSSFEYRQDGKGNLFIYKFIQSSGESEVVIPDYYDGQKVVGLFPGLFANSNITSVAFNSFIEDIPDDCFCNCYKLESLINTKNIKRIFSNAFTRTKRLNLDFLSMPNLVFIGECAFCYSGITSFNPINSDIKLSPRAFSFSNLEFSDMSLIEETIIPEGLFLGCANLKKVFLPLGTEKISVAAFRFCKNLTELLNIDNLKIIDKFAFMGCRKLNVIFNFNSIKEICESCFNGVKLQEEIEVPLKILRKGSFHGIIGVKKIKVIGKGKVPAKCFISSSVQEVELDSNITELEEECFLGSSVKKINTENITKIGDRAFAYSYVKKLNLSNLKKATGDGFFWGCNNLRKISIRPEVSKKFSPNTFKGCFLLSDDYS